ncbi:MAG: chorismate-binding protein [Rickettsiales bacterium]
MTDRLRHIPERGSFALIEKDGVVTLYAGNIFTLDAIVDIHALAQKENKNVVFLLPFCVIRERGFAANGDEPILAMLVESRRVIGTKDECMRDFPHAEAPPAHAITPSISDDEQMALLARFQREEIEGGNVSQVNLSRAFHGKIAGCTREKIVSVYRSLLGNIGQYMTILFYDGERERYFIGATPECHVEMTSDRTVMTPIAGTLRKEGRATFETRLRAFLLDPKERNELYQVTDEELKMMARIAPDGGKIEGPFLKETGNVVHTYYRLVGKRSPNAPDNLRHTLHAPTVVGSPMESAARVICKYEPESRRYYGGEIGIYDYLGRASGAEYGNMDVAIFIRCAEIDKDGEFRVQAGGGVVRDSDPLNETKENRAKASVMTDALLGKTPSPIPYLSPELTEKYAGLLGERNAHLSRFWFEDAMSQRSLPLVGIAAAVINNEDDFACMIAHMLKTMGCRVRVMDTFAFDPASDESDMVVIGPGPGDVNDESNPRMMRLMATVRALKSLGKKRLGICLGHQALCLDEKIPVTPLARSFQGEQREAHVFGKPHRLGFYNSFTSTATPETRARTDVRLHLDEGGHIIAMEGKGFVGFQFHPESIMSECGAELLAEATKKLTFRA